MAGLLLVTRMPLENTLVRFLLVSSARMRCSQGRSDGSEPFERQFLRRAQIGTVELASGVSWPPELSVNPV